MGFNATDAAVLNAAAGIFDLKLWVDAPSLDFPVVRMTIDAPASAAAVASGRPVGLLADAIDAADRLGQNVTVWIEVTQPDMPPFVAEAFDKVAGYGAGIVVTQTSSAGILCSHPPGGQLPQQFLERLAKASRAGKVWHPLAQEPALGIESEALLRSSTESRQ